MSNLYNWNAFLVSTLWALLSVLKIRNEQDRACSRSRTTVSSRYTCSRCHVLFSPVSRDRVHLSPFSIWAASGKIKNWLQKHSSTHRLAGKPAIIRRSDQAALALTDKATHQTNQRNLCELVVDMPSPFTPNTPLRVLSSHRTKWSVLAPSTAGAQRKHYNNQP